MFVGVDGKNYLLTKDDVVALPGVHAKNLRTKNLAVEVKIE
jgi:DNA replication factor GINS